VTPLSDALTTAQRRASVNAEDHERALDAQFAAMESDLRLIATRRPARRR